MRTDIRCRQCQCKLSVKSELVGKHVRCPKCSNPVKVTMAPVVLPQLGNKPGATPLMAIAVEEEPMWAEVLPDDAGFDVLPDEDEPAPPPPPPVKAKPKPVRVVTPQPIPVTTPVLVDDDEDEVEEEEDQPRPKKKKKKKKLGTNKAATSIPTWMWLVGGVGAVVTTAGLIFGIYLMMRVGTPDGQAVPWREHFIIFCINVPISLVILVLSMFISSALGGGINFGDAKLAIIGSIFLIIIVNIVNLVPVVGRYLTLLVWLVGFMTVFGLDPWEARFLLFINWLLNYALGMLIIHMMMAQMNREMDVPLDDEDPIFKKLPRDRKKNRDIPPRGKEDPDDDNMGYLRPDDWHDRMRDWVDSRPFIAISA